MARPTKEPDEKRTEIVRFRVTAFERAALESAAAAAGLHPSEFCRRRALSYRLPAVRAVADDRLIFEINRIGVNLNQIKRAAHLGKTLEGKLAAALDELQAAMQRVAGDGS